MSHERIICPHGMTLRTCRCINAAKHTTVVACPSPDLHAGRPVTAGWTSDGMTQINDAHNHVTRDIKPRGVCPGCDARALKFRPGDQALPVINDEPDIQSQVIADIEERRKVGIQRYGTALQPHNGRDALRDAYEEALDLACYLKQAIVERDG